MARKKKSQPSGEQAHGFTFQPEHPSESELRSYTVLAAAQGVQEADRQYPVVSRHLDTHCSACLRVCATAESEIQN